MKDIVLSIQDLIVNYDLHTRTRTALKNVSLDVEAGKTLVIVGESGSGKSTLLRAMIGLLDGNGKIENGKILFRGTDLAALRDRAEWQKIRGSGMALIMQNPGTSLNPLRRVGSQIAESLIRHENLSSAQAKEKACSLLEDAGFTDVKKLYNRYPHELSGGMQQRVCIVACIACSPKILLCDEPTASLDVTTQAYIIAFIQHICRQNSITPVIVTHDLGIAAAVADTIAVMKDGEIVEAGTAEDIFYDPRHPYTWNLLMSIPELGVNTTDNGGDCVDYMQRYRLKIDSVMPPPMFEISETHKVKSWLADERAPRVPLPEGLKRFRDLGFDGTGSKGGHNG